MVPLLILLMAAPVEKPSFPPRFVATSVDDVEPVGEVIGIKPGWGVTMLGSGGVDPGRLVSLRRVGGRLPAPVETGSVVRLLNGDVWPAELLDIRGEQVRVRFREKNEFSIPLSAIQSFAATDRGIQLLGKLPARRKSDVIILANGDTVSGTVGDMNAKGLSVDVDGRKILVERGKLLAFALSSDLIRTPPKTVFARFVLTDGSRISLQSATMENGHIAGTLLNGPTVTIAVDHVMSVNMHRGRVVHISDLPVRAYQHTPFLDLPWSYAINRSVSGSALSIAGDTFDSGLGLHSQCAISFDVPAKAKRFDAMVGLNDKLGMAGNAVAEVQFDGQPGGKPLELGKPVRLRLPVGASKQVTLKVDFGKGGDIGDHVDWADARFILTE